MKHSASMAYPRIMQLPFFQLSGAPSCTGIPYTGEKGVALVELALVIPLLILLCICLIGTANTVAQSMWFHQTSYQAAYAGAEASPGGMFYTPPSDLRVEAASATAQEFILKQNPTESSYNASRLLERKVGVDLPLSGLTAGETDEDTLTLTFTSAGINFWNSERITMNAQVRAPLLRRKPLPATNAGFEGSPTGYDCCGTKGSVTDCLTTSSGSTTPTYVTCTGKPGEYGIINKNSYKGF